MPNVNPCRNCNTYPFVEMMGNKPTPEMLEKGRVPIMYARFKCPECGAAAAWGQSYSYSELGMENNAKLWNKLFGAERKEKQMKAWLVRERGEFIATVVFAETRGKARARASATEACEDVHFCDIEVRRMPQADKYYKEGKTELYWFDPNDRLVLVKECGFMCDFDAFQAGYCEDCSAKAFCDRYTDV